MPIRINDAPPFGNWMVLEVQRMTQEEVDLRLGNQVSATQELDNDQELPAANQQRGPHIWTLPEKRIKRSE
jgi:hypothetical protein